MRIVTQPTAGVDPADDDLEAARHVATALRLIVSALGLGQPPPTSLAISSRSCDRELGIDDRAFRKLVRSCGIPHRMTSHGMVALRADVERALASGEVSPLPTAKTKPVATSTDDLLRALGGRKVAR